MLPVALAAVMLMVNSCADRGDLGNALAIQRKGAVLAKTQSAANGFIAVSAFLCVSALTGVAGSFRFAVRLGLRLRRAVGTVDSDEQVLQAVIDNRQEPLEPREVGRVRIEIGDRNADAPHSCFDQAASVPGC